MDWNVEGCRRRGISLEFMISCILLFCAMLVSGRSLKLPTRYQIHLLVGFLSVAGLFELTQHRFYKEELILFLDKAPLHVRAARYLPLYASSLGTRFRPESGAVSEMYQIANDHFDR
jgi:hypothetical protein